MEEVFDKIKKHEAKQGQRGAGDKNSHWENKQHSKPNKIKVFNKRNGK